MAIRTVTFKRTLSDGLVANVWIYHPQNSTVEKLVFTGDRASSSLEEGVNYTLLWAMWGQAGATLKVERRIADGAYEVLVEGSDIPPNDTVPAGAPLTWQDSLNFSI